MSTRRTVLTIALLALAIAIPGARAIAQAPNLPAGFIPPPLHPRDTELVTQELGDGVYALVSSRTPVDNSGFIVGDRGVLVIDAHINARMAGKIQAAVRTVTDKPILYLVNTNFHGDHTFGNAAFPATTTIVAHRETARHMRDFEAEKRFLMLTVENDPDVFGDATLRLPTITFDDYLAIDLGNRVVELYHFGPGNTSGDTVVWEPGTRTAWTGNLVLGGGIIPFLIDGNPDTYRRTIERFDATLEPTTIVPGHGPLVTQSPFEAYTRYLRELSVSIDAVAARGLSVNEAVETIALDDAYRANAGTPVPAAFVEGLHQFNVAVAYQRKQAD